MFASSGARKRKEWALNNDMKSKGILSDAQISEERTFRIPQAKENRWEEKTSGKPEDMLVQVTPVPITPKEYVL